MLRQIPSVDEVLRSPSLLAAITREGRAATTDAVRAVLDRLREEINSGHLDDAGAQLAIEGIAAAADRELHRALGFSLQRVINATGVILHTNFGRAPLSTVALQHLSDIASGYSNLEFDLSTGKRGRRDAHVERLFERLLAVHNYASLHTEGAPDTIVVNNCAAAVLLALNTLAEGGEVIVSRGELVEIGGSFRVPDVMAKSGAHLREVGTTNRTRLSDYEKGITDNTRLLLRVHRSNFAMIGFTEQPTSQELVALGRKHRVPVMEDLGNGLLLNLAAAGVHGEYGLHESLAAGTDVVCVSGDKLLGGPQAGIISGRKELVRRMRANPLFRALRVDKLTYAALESTLLACVREDYSQIPALRMIFTPAAEIRRRSESLLAQIGRKAGVQIEVIEGKSLIGGGTAPNATLPTFLLAITSDRKSPEQLQAGLRSQSPPVISRIEDDRLMLDMRTVFPEEERGLASALEAVLQFNH
ncbi:MAG TPA: L-seryl-tRNA(Sec) selenium transferase [Terriglobales bacterium]|nr:L-seryl-tRNA(Sec) selenium transferase [Terriglobales bacterium]